MGSMEKKGDRLLTRSQRMLARVGAVVPKYPEGKEPRGNGSNKENASIDDDMSDGRVSPFTPSEIAFLTGNANKKETNNDQPTTPVNTKKLNNKPSTVLQENNLKNVQASPKPNLAAQLKSLVPEYSPSTSATSNVTRTSDSNALRRSSQHPIPDDDFSLPLRKRKLLENLLMMDEIEESDASKTTLTTTKVSAPTLTSDRVNSAPEPTLPGKNGLNKYSSTTTETPETSTFSETEKRFCKITPPTISGKSNLNSDSVQHNTTIKPVKVVNSVTKPTIPAASADLRKSVAGKANDKKIGTTTAIQTKSVNRKFVQPRPLNSHKRSHEAHDKQDDLNGGKRERLTEANNEQPRGQKARAAKNRTQYKFSDQGDDGSDPESEELFMEGFDGDVDGDPSWLPEKTRNDDDDDDDDDDDAENEENIGNQSVSANAPRVETNSVTESVDEETEYEAEYEADPEDDEPEKIRKTQVRKAMQKKRSLGEEYKQINGKVVPARMNKPPHVCKAKKCHLIVTPAIGETLFKEYWEQGSYERKVSYICGKISCSTPERSRKRDLDSDKSKEVVWQYFFSINGERHQVCKSTFLTTLGETDTFLRRCQSKMRETVSGIAPKERRGIVTPKHAHTPDFKDLIRAHINRFPAYVSHYCRKQTKQKYLSSTLSVKTMYNKFIEENEEKNITCSYSAYYRIFSKMGLKFKQPPQDTCNTCDELQAKIKFAKSEEESNQLKTEHEVHLRKAEEAYKLKRQYKNLAKQDKSVKCLIYDLEQVLPTPDVSCGKAYYLRQLSTYNLTVVDCSTNITYNYMWHEGESSRGALEVSSCLFTHIMDEVSEEVTQLYVFSDCCSGQNRNSIVAAMFNVVLETHTSIKKIDHIFLVPGHTRMECDAKHSRIEHQKDKCESVHIPSQWYDLVRSIGPSYKVREMSENFINFPLLLTPDGPLIMREKLENGSKMYWGKTHWLKYNAQSVGVVKVKPSFAVDSEFFEYSMIRGNGKNRKLAPNWFTCLKRKEPINAIPQCKMDDIRNLLKYIPETYHQFYESLKVDATIQVVTDPDLPSDNEED